MTFLELCWTKMLLNINASGQTIFECLDTIWMAINCQKYENMLDKLEQLLIIIGIGQ